MALLFHLIINDNLKVIVGMNDDSIEMSPFVKRRFYVDSLSDLLILIHEADQHFLLSPTDIRAKGKEVFRVMVKLLLVCVRRNDLEISTSTVHILCEFNCELENEVFVFVVHSLCKGKRTHLVISKILTSHDAS